ncbi:hypothetical protein MTR_2g012910 [Medicago truncatula]|uniref:Uncharacterized protein n=1 Tax=Medicago truncatula TaxID=3880 RepID=G7INZ5_MEDTR|nr:hypothetical protein MTR_2g012910 [Medicago truncatula]
MNSLQIGEWLRSSLLTPNFHQTNNHDRTILSNPTPATLLRRRRNPFNLLSTSLSMAFPISHLFTLTLTPSVGFPPGSDPSAPITVMATKLFPLENENVLQLENEKIEFFYFDQLYDGSY